MEDDATFKYIRKLLALPFLPSHEIEAEFIHLEQKAGSEALKLLVEYISQQWIKGNVFHIRDWSVFDQAVRTNNDLEGWHNALNRRAHGRSHLPFYMLVELLHQEARLSKVQIKLVSDGKITKVERKKYRERQDRITEAWAKYKSQQKTARQLLRTISKLNGPTRAL